MGGTHRQRSRSTGTAEVRGAPIITLKTPGAPVGLGCPPMSPGRSVLAGSSAMRYRGREGSAGTNWERGCGRERGMSLPREKRILGDFLGSLLKKRAGEMWDLCRGGTGWCGAGGGHRGGAFAHGLGTFPSMQAPLSGDVQQRPTPLSSSSPPSSSSPLPPSSPLSSSSPLLPPRCR